MNFRECEPTARETRTFLLAKVIILEVPLESFLFNCGYVKVGF